MKARIKQDNFYGGTRTDEWLQANANFNVNGQLVSEWTLTDVLPNQDLIKPFWNGTTWIEGYSDEDRKAEIMQEVESQKQAVLERLNKELILDKAQELDDDTAVENSVVYPFWDSGISVTINQKYQHFVGTELRLYKVVQSHTTQADWQPQDVPALFTRIGFVDEILVWVQPTGAQDAYNIGDKVKFPDENGNTYQSNIDANVWSPSVTPQFWDII
jgi:hypothetical protein